MNTATTTWTGETKPPEWCCKRCDAPTLILIHGLCHVCISVDIRQASCWRKQVQAVNRLQIAARLAMAVLDDIHAPALSREYADKLTAARTRLSDAIAATANTGASP